MSEMSEKKTRFGFRPSLVKDFTHYEWVPSYLGKLGADWVGSYGSPGSKDEDIAIIYFGDIPNDIRQKWTDIRKEITAVCLPLDPVVISLKEGKAAEILGADPQWPHPKEDIQNCLQQTVPELADRIKYIPPDKRNIEEKIIQCKAWLDYFSRNPVNPKRRTPPYEIWDLWSKRAGFIGIQLLALKQGQDAGYTKESVRQWAEKNVKMMDGRSLPPTDHPVGDHHHDFQRTRDFLEAVINDSEREFLLVSSLSVDGDGEVREDERWEPYAPVFEPLKIKAVKEDLGACALCGKGLSYDEPLYPAQIFFSKVFVHPACAHRVAESLADLSDGKCHLEFGEDGSPYWVWGECFSSSRIEYSVWDKEWNLIEKSSGGPEHPL